MKEGMLVQARDGGGKKRNDDGDKEPAESEYFSKRELGGLPKNWDGSMRERNQE